MSCSQPKANLIVPVWQQIIYKYLWEVLCLKSIASLTHNCYQKEEFWILYGIIFFSRRLRWLRVLPLPLPPLLSPILSLLFR